MHSPTMRFLSDFDLHLLAEGTDARIYEKLGAHPIVHDGVAGTRFAVWAPHARSVSVVGDFNDWDPARDPLERDAASGVWERFVAGARPGARYKYAITARDRGGLILKADPFAVAAETPPGNASRVWDLSGYEWGDADWLAARAGRNSLNAPISSYEVHLGSWMRVPEQGNRWLTYRELGPRLADYVTEMGFTHVELMPVAEHPLDKSWGYQVTGFYAPTARFGTPQDFMALVDTLHRRGIGVILDWVPAHFPRDAHGLAEFDGTHLYEPADPRRGLNVKWNTYNFDFSRPQVLNFLIGNALYWLEVYHVDGLRVDAVESLLRLDFYRKPGDWLPNARGGAENLEAVAFMQQFNRRVQAAFPGALTIAEDATARPNVTRPAADDGLAFDLKWDLGWVHDTLDHYMTLDPIRRKEAHGKPVFRMHYAFRENYLLPLSHDEVSHAKGSLLAKMPGDDWQKRANLRLLLGYQYTLPGKKLLFMGDEFGQWREWNSDASLDWHLLGDPRHAALRRWVRDLNTQYRAEPALHQLDCRPEGFEWIDANDAENSVLTFLRRGMARDDMVLVVCNFTPVVRRNYRVGAPAGGRWEEILNSDATLYGGSGQGNMGGLAAAPIGWHGRPHSLNLILPPLAMIALKRTK